MKTPASSIRPWRFLLLLLLVFLLLLLFPHRSTAHPSVLAKNIPEKYGVFLSFRGKDIRKAFVSHLCEALRQKGIPTSIHGEVFQMRRLQIPEYKVSAVILSEIYMKSTGCLEELVRIMEYRKTRGQHVVPIFYYVDPSDVEKQAESNEEAFERHHKHTAETWQRWRNALIELGNIPRYIVREYSTEAQAIKDIVKDISAVLGPPSFEFDVFLNFRGDDVRYGFLYNLKEALQKEGINTFYDDESVRKGDEITMILEKIEVSKMSIIIFSTNYANSMFCLKELVKILECRKRWDHEVVPVFYKVPPEVVAKQSGNYEEAFRKHENEKGTDSKEVGTWRASLLEAAALSGFVLENKRPEKYDIREIVEVVYKTLERFDLEKTLSEKKENTYFWLIILIMAMIAVFALSKIVGEGRSLETTPASCARPRSFEFDVFLNFRSEDVRYCFVDDLTAALQEKGGQTLL